MPEEKKMQPAKMPEPLRIGDTVGGPGKTGALMVMGEAARLTAREKLLAAFESHGIDSELISSVARDLMTATTNKVFYNPKTGEVIYSDPLNDNSTRLAAVKLMLEFIDVMPSKKIDINDKRQTRDLAAVILGRMEERGLLGSDDKAMPDGVEDAEWELLADNAKSREVKEEEEGGEEDQ